MAQNQHIIFKAYSVQHIRISQFFKKKCTCYPIAAEVLKRAEENRAVHCVGTVGNQNSVVVLHIGYTIAVALCCLVGMGDDWDTLW